MFTWMYTDGFCRFCKGAESVCGMESSVVFKKLKRRILLVGLVAVMAIPCGFTYAKTAAQEQKETPVQDNQDADESEHVMKWLIDKAESGDVDLKDEESIRRAIEEAETEFAISFDEKEQDRIVTVLQKMDAVGIGTEEMLDQAKRLYQKYGEDVVQEANVVINDAVEGALKSATDNFFASMKKAVSDFFKGLF